MTSERRQAQEVVGPAAVSMSPQVGALTAGPYDADLTPRSSAADVGSPAPIHPLHHARLVIGSDSPICPVRPAVVLDRRFSLLSPAVPNVRDLYSHRVLPRDWPGEQISPATITLPEGADT